MVRGARSGSSSRRSSRGRGLLAASAFDSSSVLPPVAAGSGEFTPLHPRVPGSGEFTPPHPRVPATGPSSMSPPVAAGSGMSTPSPHTIVGPVPKDTVSLQEGGDSFYDNTLREVWINGKNAQKVCQSAYLTLWRERAPTWMRRDYWESLCNIWAAERWQKTSTTMKVNRAANPEANMHTSGYVSFATHQSRLEKDLKRSPTFQEVFDKTHKKKGTDQYISDRSREVTESYSQQMTEKYVGEEEQPQLDPEVWVAASGAPKKGHVYGFGHSMDKSRVLSGASSSASQTSAFTTAGALGTSPSEMMGFIRDEISGLESRLAQTMESRLVVT
ncbi:hypothetical protein Taro_043539 [Colocasia esculenta]|uniref:Uncharacterized protein n=1 Tax=Colocasia esculenta TaxID=4460 RepID=A0A843WGQ0_COLES|nr:hypothetical protein [Colocasia esculenta]